MNTVLLLLFKERRKWREGRRRHVRAPRLLKKKSGREFYTSSIEREEGGGKERSRPRGSERDLLDSFRKGEEERALVSASSEEEREEKERRTSILRGERSFRLFIILDSYRRI